MLVAGLVLRSKLRHKSWYVQIVNPSHSLKKILEILYELSDTGAIQDSIAAIVQNKSIEGTLLALYHSHSQELNSPNVLWSLVLSIPLMNASWFPNFCLLAMTSSKAGKCLMDFSYCCTDFQILYLMCLMPLKSWPRLMKFFIP